MQKEQFSSERNNFHGNKMAHSLISNRKGKKYEKIIRERSSKKIRAAISTNFLSSPTALSSSFFLVSPRTCLHGYHQEMESCCCFDKRPFRRESGEKDAELLKKRKSLLCFPSLRWYFDESERPNDCFQTYHEDKEMNENVDASA